MTEHYTAVDIKDWPNRLIGGYMETKRPGTESAERTILDRIYPNRSLDNPTMPAALIVACTICVSHRETENDGLAKYGGWDYGANRVVLNVACYGQRRGRSGCTLHARLADVSRAFGNTPKRTVAYSTSRMDRSRNDERQVDIVCTRGHRAWCTRKQQEL